MYTDKQELLENINYGMYRGNPDKIKEEISEELLKDNDVIFELIKNNQQLVNVFGETLIQKPELMEKVFNQIDSTLYHRLNDNYKNNEKFMLQLLEYDSNAVYNLGPELRKNLDFMEKAVEINEEAVYYADKSIKEELQENVKDILELDTKMKLMLSEEKYKLISNYPETKKIFKKIASQKKLAILEACILKLNDKNLDTTEWVRGLEKITDNMQNTEYQELLSNIKIDEIDTDTLYNVLQNPNYYNIKNAEQLSKYEETKQQVCDAIINDSKEVLNEFPKIKQMEEIEQTQFAVLQKQYGIDVVDAKTIWSKCSDIEDIKNDKSPNIKSYISSIITVLQTKSKDILQKIYKTEPIISKTNETLSTINEAKKMYAKEFNDTLFEPEKSEPVQDSREYLKQALGMKDEEIEKNIPKDIKIIDAGTEFNMLITSIGAFSDGSYQENNYYKNWNREIKSAPGVSCSYIGNDMRATAPIQEFCYGFSQMSEESLLMEGTQNLGSTTEKNKLSIKHIDGYIENFTPENLKNFSRSYNEMVYNRTQDGERKQPDYIVIFKYANRTEGNIKSAAQAVKDFKAQGIDLPIVVVDIEKCKEAEKQKLDNMVNKYKETKDENLKEQIENKINRNRVTNNQEFSTYYQKLEEATKHKTNIINFDTYQTAYENTSVEERKQETQKIVQMNREIEKTAEMDR